MTTSTSIPICRLDADVLFCEDKISNPNPQVKFVLFINIAICKTVLPRNH